ncbi:hypothetical protein Prum_036080 [Phytohabitans rumicis]|uniref:Uncharacterized protein n=2 Tax=Phytohabitans rumicis TaxID=1076125 RepID=A0A6V8L773_9ACTN|nr:hypothetical protein Prum_036080 [Phytohabitans rumicis]
MALDLLSQVNPWIAVAALISPLLLRVAGHALPRLIVAVVAIFKIPADKLPDVLKALAELFRGDSRSHRRGGRR